MKLFLLAQQRRIKVKSRFKSMVVVWVLVLGVSFSFPRAGAQKSRYFSDWPDGTSPQEVGKLVAEHFVLSPHQGPTTIIYPEVCAWYGALTFAEATGDRNLESKLTARLDPLMGGEESAKVPGRRHVDDEIFGVVPLAIYLEAKDKKYLEFGKSFADRQWDAPTSDGLSSETRFWIDDMYMLTMLQVEAYRATGDRQYIDRAALEMAAYLDKLQQPNGLFYHAPDVPFYWGRGDGWVAAGMAEMLRSLPEDNPHRGRILAGYKKMMKALLACQSKDGTWRQLLDHEEAWLESSSTGMFTFAMITGVKNGWLDEQTYGPAARRAWLALVGYIDQNGDVTSICEGTNKKNDLDYYLMRRRKTGDFHGQAPVLWAAAALLQ
jgi:rhamnogalacturonyl hydrolase YesR